MQEKRNLNLSLYRCIILIFCICISGLPIAAQQANLIKGYVMEAGTRKPLSGATVRYKKDQQITHTTASGQFLIGRVIDDSLYVSFVGYTPAIISGDEIASKTPNLVIYLTPVQTGLQEVVVSTGYQSLPKERATGSFEKVDQTTLSRRPGKDLLSHLEGTSSILFDKRNKDQQLLVRGRSTLFANNAPLLVVDNFPFDGSIEQINPNDVESVTLLKDAAAASIWGAQAANGVLVITTRKGRYNQPLKVEAATNITVMDKPDLFKDNATSSGDFIDVEEKLFKEGFYNNDISNTYNRPPLSPVVEILQKEKAGLIGHEQAVDQIAALRQHDVRDDYRKYLYRTAISQQHSVNLSGGAPGIHYFFSAGYDDQQNSLVRNGSQRITLRSENSLRLTKQLELQLGLLYAYSKTTNNNPGPDMLSPGGGKFRYYPYAMLADHNGAPLPLVKDYRAAFTDTAGAGMLQDWKYYPLREVGLADNRTTMQNYRLNLGARYSITPALSAELRYQYERQAGGTWNLYNGETYYARNLINLYSQIAGSGQVLYGIPRGGILDEGASDLTSHSGRAQLNYNQHWKERHQLAALAGLEMKEVRTRNNIHRTYGYDPDLLTFSNVNYVDYLPTYLNLNGSQRIPDPLAFGDIQLRYVSYYANASYTFDNRYVLSASARKDASNLFGVKTNQKGVPLWSAGLRWNISQEKFFNLSWLSMLAARITYGYNGNTSNRLSALTIINYGAAGSNFYINQPFATIVTPPNPSLRWEKTGTLNIGLDFRLRGNALSGSIDYYTKKSTDLIGITPLDPTTGVVNMSKNSAIIQGRGIDISLQSRIIDRKVKLEAALLFSYNTNKITRYLYKYTRASSYIGSGINPLEGRPTDAILSYRWEGLDANGNPQGWLNGSVSKDYYAITNKSLLSDLVYSGRALPPFYGAFRPSVSYSRWTLSANFLFKLGHYFLRNSINYSALYQNWTGHSDFALRWQQPGDEKTTNVPAMIYPADPYRDGFYLQSSALVEKAGMIRWKDLNLQYTITPQGKHSPLFSQLLCYLYLENIATIYRANKYGLDPEYGASVPPRSISFGIKATF
ncbi:TonB-linked SusC/RagA family outer membrane protein [Chitinophaga dinghuensis]|uniref:TonB-linked SusC/RagA family outer membrane protein n=1 Tax=Chitinophaga dinghuensis TaxID=1539050 RepID=A0A327VXP0_9BACT|nr:SusC/RagA family TonB-linked outer membrane protein [Chitinophaga dinghuensis]RAJ80103.1 TonB-linked SusC/RagA family outer membrane protein [Chitinophaga dinghuensis]